LNCRGRFAKNTKISNCMKIRPVGADRQTDSRVVPCGQTDRQTAELFRADRRTDRQTDSRVVPCGQTDGQT